MTESALCQCLICHKYLAENRRGSTLEFNNCVECGGSLRLAAIRGTLTDPLSLEVLALLGEECAEVAQRIGKIMRWGWEADFEGTTQQYKLEVELGDVLAAMIVADENEIVDLENVMRRAEEKLQKLRDDADGPRQRLLHAHPPRLSAYLVLAAYASNLARLRRE